MTALRPPICSPTMPLAAGGLVASASTAIIFPFAPVAAAGMTSVLVAGALLVIRPLKGTDILAVLLFGAVVLNYGWANIGLQVAGIPLPITQILLALVVPYALLRIGPLSEIGAPAILLLAFVGYATIRLLVDFPVWGVDAVRDFTTPLEMLVFFAGYAAIRERGLEWGVRLWTVVFVALAAYVLLYPVRESLQPVAPDVGLQRSVPLLSFAGLAASAGAAVLFSLSVCRQRHWAWLILICTTGFVMLLQLRGLYIVLPLAFLVLFLLQTNKDRVLQLSRMTGIMLIGLTVMLLLTVSGIRLDGRIGGFDFSMIQAQLMTLTGDDGPGSGSLRHRIEWTNYTLDQMSATPQSVIFGVGLGPDLTGGFAMPEGQAVRKPHNDYLEILARYGILGFLLLSVLFFTVLIRIFCGLRQQIKNSRERRFLAWSLAASLVFLFIAGTQPYLSFPYGTIPLFTLLGMAYAVAVGSPGAPDPDDEPRLDINKGRPV